MEKAELPLFDFEKMLSKAPSEEIPGLSHLTKLINGLGKGFGNMIMEK